jgi:hypothetical protein
MVAVELALTALVACGFSDAHFVLHSDNKGVCAAMEAGRSRNVSQNEILRHTVHLFREHDIWFTMLWVPTKDNVPDGPSRGWFPSVNNILHTIPKLPYLGA